ncbi:hypothetical protein P0136_09580 [Lentisphaerota bacterium ZTH]|nr:hypothetical protein JYG24_12905 [Lentisphaerota bacterium]WET05615.1 hypothetical protein P0136_09580 [Lentisphaerota bacterium ZTH]
MKIKTFWVGLAVLCMVAIPAGRVFGMQGFYGCFQNFSSRNVTFKVLKSKHIKYVDNIGWNKQFYIKADNTPFTSYAHIQFYVDGKKIAYFDVKLAFKKSHAELRDFDQSAAPELQMYADFVKAPGEGGEDYWFVTFAPNESRWMGEMANTLKNIPISDVLLPGSHDAGTYDFSGKCPVADTNHVPGWVVELLKLAKISVIYNYFAGVCKTQDMNFYDQLNHGIRYFDMRICKGRDDDKIYFTHTMQGLIPLEDLMDQFKKYYEQPGTEKEVILLDFQEMINVDPAKVFNIINERVGQYLVPREMGVNARLGDIWAQNKRIILIFRENYDDPAVWPRGDYFYNSANGRDVNEAYKHMQDSLNNRNPGKMFCLGTNLTEEGDEIVKGFLNPLGSTPKTLKQIDLKYHYPVHSWLNSHIDDLVKNGNAIHENFCNGLWLTELCKHVNTLKANKYAN